MSDEVIINKKNVKDVIKNTLKVHSRIIFNGNNYSEEWKKEAQKRGLPIANSFVESIKSLIDPHTIEVMQTNGIYSKVELESFAEINYDNYSKTINIEAKTMMDMVAKKYIPCVIKYMNHLAETINNIKKASSSVDLSVIEKLLDDTSKLLVKAKKDLEILKEKTSLAQMKPKGMEKAMFYRNEIVSVMEKLRNHIDGLELLVDSNIWPVPSYGELMYK